MNPKMVILNSKEYQEKLSEAMAYSLSDQHEKALSLLLELKEKRWVNFDLFERIAQEYLALGQYNQAQMIIKQIKPINDQQKGQLLELEQQTKLQMEYGNQNQFQQQLQQFEDGIRDFEEVLFLETTELKQEKAELNQNTRELSILDNFQYYQSVKIGVKSLYGSNFSGIYNLSHELQFDKIQTIFRFENHKQTLNLLEICEENKNTLILKAICYQQMKQYKLALNTLKRLCQATYSIDIAHKVCMLQYLIGQSLMSKIDPDNQSFSLSYIELSILRKQYNIFPKTIQHLMIRSQKQIIIAENNTLIFLYNNLFIMEYSLSNNNPILQRICDFLIKHAPRYSAGYAHQYQLFIDKKQMDKAFSLEQPLVQCEDCTLKFLTLAKLYKEKKQFYLSHQALVKAKQIDEFNEEIYQIESDLFRTQKMYQQAYLTIKNLVHLEQENYRFFCLTIAPMVDKYEYYRVVDLLKLVDNDSQKFDQLKLLFKILSYKTDQEDERIFTLIQSMEEQDKVLFSGHYWLQKNQVAEAHRYYNNYLVFLNKVFDETYCMEQVEVINKLKQIQSLKQHEIADVICQVGILNYKPSSDKQFIIHERYINTIGFVLTSIVYYESLDQNIQIINSKYDIEVPKIKNFKSIIKSIVERTYGKSYIPSEKYQSYIETGLKQLQRLLTSTEVFMNSLYEFSDKYKSEMIEQFMVLDHEIVQADEGIKQIYQIPFFADPISRYALVSAIKMIGYYTEFELVDYYKSIEQWLTSYMIKQNIEAYYQIIRK